MEDVLLTTHIGALVGLSSLGRLSRVSKTLRHALDADAPWQSLAVRMQLAARSRGEVRAAAATRMLFAPSAYEAEVAPTMATARLSAATSHALCSATAALAVRAEGTVTFAFSVDELRALDDLWVSIGLVYYTGEGSPPMFDAHEWARAENARGRFAFAEGAWRIVALSSHGWLLGRVSGKTQVDLNLPFRAGDRVEMRISFGGRGEVSFRVNNAPYKRAITRLFGIGRERPRLVHPVAYMIDKSMGRAAHEYATVRCDGTVTRE